MSQVAEGIYTLINYVGHLAGFGEETAKLDPLKDLKQLSDTPVPGSGQPYTPGPTTPPGGTGGAGGNTPGGGGTQIIPNAQDVINERADAANLAQVAYEEQGLTSIMNLKLQEQRQESGIAAGAAARGLKLEGSPLYQLNAQKSAGVSAIGSAERQFELGDKAQRMSTLASYNAGLLGLSNQSIQIQTNLTNEWMSVLSNVIGMGTSFIGKFWNPAQFMASSTYSAGGYTSAYQTSEYGSLP